MSREPRAKGRGARAPKAEKVKRPVTELRECKSCLAPILWVHWKVSDKAMPVDASPDPRGSVVLTHRKSEDKLVAEKFNAAAHPPSRNRYTSHFETCPHAARHRTPR